jgi:prepilin peptidase CpaA
MPELSLQQMVLFVSVGLFTLAAAFSDFRARKIPNRLTLPMFGVGWVYQLSFFGLSGLGDGALAFLLGFGMLFVLWMVGGGGGGDVKLMGALAVWLGFRMTLLVLVSSTLIVVVGTMLIILGSVLSQGVWRTKSRFVAESPAGNTPNPQVGETIQGRQQRRIMAYAIPVAIATWAVMIWKLPLM